ncbi:MAG: amidohydrolase family protein [Lautropia sp.]
MDSNDLVISNAECLDVRSGEIRANTSVRIKDGLIVEISSGRIQAPHLPAIDAKGRTLMPGLIDCHVHTLGELEPNLGASPSLVAIFGAQRLHRMLRRGFTTVRDAGGADAGFRAATAQGVTPGPRMFVSGRALSQTGGHGDMRAQFDVGEVCGCSRLHRGFGRVADGVPAVLQAARDEIRMGADQIKIVASGGVGSRSGTLHTMQFSDEEIQAIVGEAARWDRYVMAHVYSAEGIKRLVRLGVRTIEHGNLLDEEGARMIAQSGAYLVPNLIAYESIAKYGKKQGYPAEGLARLAEIFEAGTRSLEIAQRAGVKIGYGSDLVRDPESQSEEFLIRAKVMKPIDVIRSATLIGAEIVRQSGKLGVVEVGAVADLLLVDGNPLEDLTLLTQQGRHIAYIIKEGRVEKDSADDDFDARLEKKMFARMKGPLD